MVFYELLDHPFFYIGNGIVFDLPYLDILICFAEIILKAFFLIHHLEGVFLFPYDNNFL